MGRLVPGPRAERLGRCLLVLGWFLLGAASLAEGTGCEPSRLGRPPSEVPTALIFSGGGAKGAWEAGVAAVLIAKGVPIRLVAGTSAGALNATIVAAGQVNQLEELWRSITREQVYRLRPSVVFAGLLPGWLTLWRVNVAGSLFDPSPLRALIEARLDLERVRRSPVRLVIVTADLGRRAKRLFDNHSVSVDALMGSVAMPGAFPPARVDGAWLVDGGLTGRAPVLDALEAGPEVERAVVVMSYAEGEQGAPPTTIRRALEEALEMGMTSQIRRDVELARLRYPRVEVQLLVPAAPLDLRPLDFEPEAMARALEQGKADALACLSRWRE
jgi:NTE family protein